MFSAFGYGAVRDCGGQNRTLSPSVRLTRTAAKYRGYTRRQPTSRGSKPAEVKSGRVKGELKIEKRKKIKGERQDPGGEISKSNLV